MKLRRDAVLISAVTAMPGDSLTTTILDLHLRAIGREIRAEISQFLAFGLAGGAEGGRAFGLVSLICRSGGIARTIASDEMLPHLPMQQSVSGEVKRIDLDFYLIARMYETDVTVADHGFDLQLTVSGDDYH